MSLKKIQFILAVFAMAPYSLFSQITFSASSVNSGNTSVVTISAHNTSGAAEMIFGVNIAFYIDGTETSYVSVDYSPSGWNTAGNTSESEVAANNPMIPTTHDTRLEMSFFDGNFTGSTIMTGNSIPLFTITFDNSDGTANFGGDFYISSDAEDPGSTVYIDAAYNGIPVVIFGNPIVPLPVELVSFDASPQNKQINLRWKSATEDNFDGYEIQRADDGENFQKIAWIEGRGGLHEANYFHADEHIIPKEIYYYRLKIFDLDGSYEFSEVRSARIESGQETFAVYPNPIARNSSLIIENMEEEKMEFLLFNSTGQLLKELFIEPEHIFTFQLQDIPAGILIYKIKSMTGLKSGKIIVQ